MFRNAEVGDNVFDYLNQTWGTIVEIIDSSKYPLRVSYNNENGPNISLYTKEGYISEYNTLPVLFWDEVKPITPPKKPLPTLEVDTKVLVWDSDENKNIKDILVTLMKMDLFIVL